MSADTAPAAMPGEIERLIAEAAMVCHQAGYHDLGQGLDELVAPILAEKERRIAGLLSDLGGERSLTSASQDMYKRAKARALAAEAALAAERGRCAKVIEDNLDEDPDFLMGLLIRIRSPSAP